MVEDERLLLFVPLFALSMLILSIRVDEQVPLMSGRRKWIKIRGRYVYLKYDGIPLDLFQTNEHYYQAAMIFIMCLSFCFSLIRPDSGFFENLIKFAIGAVVFYPLFVCYSSKDRRAPQFAALLYALMIIVDYIILCTRSGIEAALAFIPQPICALLLAIYFISTLTVAGGAETLIFLKDARVRISHDMDYNYVARLLRKPTSSHRGEKRLWTGGTKTFRYPARLILSVLITLILAYMILIYFIFHINSKLSELCDAVDWLDCSGEQAGKFALSVAIVVPPLSLAYLTLQMWLLLRNYYDDIILLRRGRRERIPQGVVPGDILNFIGYQIGYGLLGFVFLISNIIIVCWIMFLIAINNDVRGLIKNYIFFNNLTWPALYTLVSGASMVVGTTRLLVMSSFLVRYLGIFSHLEYLFMFINLFRGLIVFIWSKILVPLAFIAFTSFRIDKTVSQRADFGYRAYIAMLLADHEYNNPIKNLFIKFIQGEPGLLHTAPRHIRRWQLYYTLLKNPQLKKYRKQRIITVIPMPDL